MTTKVDNRSTRLAEDIEEETHRAIEDFRRRYPDLPDELFRKVLNDTLNEMVRQLEHDYWGQP